MNLKVKWDSKEYNPTKVGKQTLTGELVLPENVTNSQGIKPMFFVTVLEEELPEPTVESIKVSPLTKTVKRGETFKITATTSPSGVPADVVWSVDADDIVGMTATGKTATVTALKEGTVNVIAQVKDNKELTSKSKVTVEGAPKPLPTISSPGNISVNSIDELIFTGEAPDLSTLTIKGSKYNLSTEKNSGGSPSYIIKAPTSKTLLSTPIIGATATGETTGETIEYQVGDMEPPGIHFIEDVKNLTLNVTTGFSPTDTTYSLRHTGAYHRIDGVVKDSDMKITLETKLESEEEPKVIESDNTNRIVSKVPVPEMVDGELTDKLTVKFKVEYEGADEGSGYNLEFRAEIEAEIHKENGEFVVKILNKK